MYDLCTFEFHSTFPLPNSWLKNYLRLVWTYIYYNNPRLWRKHAPFPCAPMSHITSRLKRGPGGWKYFEHSNRIGYTNRTRASFIYSRDGGVSWWSTCYYINATPYCSFGKLPQIQLLISAMFSNTNSLIWHIHEFRHSYSDMQKWNSFSFPIKGSFRKSCTSQQFKPISETAVKEGKVRHRRAIYHDSKFNMFFGK